MNARAITVAGALAAVAGRWNGYNARPEDLYTAMAATLDDAGLLMTPETAAELERLRSEHSRYQTAWRRARTRAISLAGAADRAGARVRDMQPALQDALGALLGMQMERDSALKRAAELESALAARMFYLADVEGVEGGPTLHTTVEAAKAWVESVDDAGDWFERDGVWEQWHCDLDTDRPTSRGTGSVLPLVVQGDGIVAEAERLRQELLAHAPQAAILRQVRDSQADEIRRMRTEQDAVRVALGCEDDDDWDDVVHRVKRLTGAQGGAV